MATKKKTTMQKLADNAAADAMLRRPMDPTLTLVQPTTIEALTSPVNDVGGEADPFDAQLAEENRISAACYDTLLAETTTARASVDDVIYTISGPDGYSAEVECAEDVLANEVRDQVRADSDRPSASDGTYWIVVDVADPDGREVIDLRIAIHPRSPRCVDGTRSHTWTADWDVVGGIRENPGVWGHGGGATITEACACCGCGRHTDTWAQDPVDGTQGLTSYSYVVGEFPDAVDAIVGGAS